MPRLAQLLLVCKGQSLGRTEHCSGPVVRRSAARVYGYGLPFPRAYGYVTPAGAPLRLRLRAPGERGVPVASLPQEAPLEAWGSRTRGAFCRQAPAEGIRSDTTRAGRCEGAGLGSRRSLIQASSPTRAEISSPRGTGGSPEQRGPPSSHTAQRRTGRFADTVAAAARKVELTLSRLDL